jgi:hypothetical protein
VDTDRARARVGRFRIPEPCRSAQRALAEVDNALDLAKQLVFELDGELRWRRDAESPAAAAE